MNLRNNKVINDFGKEWEAYNQTDLSSKELNELFKNYFDIFPFHLLNKNSIGFDMGCGSGRWAKLIAPRVKKLYCIEPSKKAINEAKKNLRKNKNCEFLNCDVLSNPLEKNSQDFGYCLGVLHHMSDTELALKNCINKLKKGSPFLLYLYYKFDNKPLWYKFIWKQSDFFRQLISILPFKLKLFITILIAIFIYWPLARISLVLENLGIDVTNIPISSYKKTSFYTMKTDALDRFGTKLEKRFTKTEILEMMEGSGLKNIKFKDNPPFWVAVGEKN